MPSFASQISTRFRSRPKKSSRICLSRTIINLCNEGRLKEAVDYLDLLSAHGLRLDSDTIAFLLQQCEYVGSLVHAKWIHLHLKTTGRKYPTVYLSNVLLRTYFKCGSSFHACKMFERMPQRNIFSWNTMLDGYAKCGMIDQARRLFDGMPYRDVVSWNTMLTTLAKSGQCAEAFDFYNHLRKSNIQYNHYTFAGLSIACVQLQNVRITQQVHSHVLVCGLMPNFVLSSSLVDAYAKCREIDDARKLFDEMPERDVVTWTALVSGYVKCGDLESARILFDSMPKRNSVSWTSMIGGYVRNGCGHTALKLFSEMLRAGMKPDQFTFSSVLASCASIASLKLGKQIHAYMIRISLKPNSVVISTLIDMYSKCGILEAARLVFDITNDKEDIILWNTMISSLAQHGCGEEALKLFRTMMKSLASPDRTTFILILTACSHSGLVKEGIHFFESMAFDHGILPEQEHYSCLIDLLGRAGHFDLIMHWLDNMPYEWDDGICNAILGACRIHGNIELGKKVAEKVMELDPQSPAAYVLLSNIYASKGKWELVEKVRHLMSERQVRKEQALSWIEIENNLHTFTTSDQLHSQKQEIYELLGLLSVVIETDSSKSSF